MRQVERLETTDDQARAGDFKMPDPHPSCTTADEKACWRLGWQAAMDATCEAAEKSFRAGYHCQWIRAERRYIFDPAMTPGDPDGAFAAFEHEWGTGTLPAAVDPHV